MKYAGIFSVVVKTGNITYENFYAQDGHYAGYGGYDEMVAHLYERYDGKPDNSDDSVWVVVEVCY